MDRVDLANAVWFKSSRSNGQANCVEVAFLGEGAVAMRDSKDRSGPVLTFTEGGWQAFIAGAQDGAFGTP